MNYYTSFTPFTNYYLCLSATPLRARMERTLQVSPIWAEGVLQKHRDLTKDTPVGVMAPHGMQMLQFGAVFDIRHVLNRVHHVRESVLPTLGALPYEAEGRGANVGVFIRNPGHVVIKKYWHTSHLNGSVVNQHKRKLK